MITDATVSPIAGIRKGLDCSRAYAQKSLSHKHFSDFVSPVKGVSSIFEKTHRSGGKYPFPVTLRTPSGERPTGLQGLHSDRSPKIVKRSQGLNLNDSAAINMLGSYPETLNGPARFCVRGTA